MVYQSVLNGLCQSLRGARGALLLDAGGEVVVEVDRGDERLRLIGAYQAIALGAATRTAARYGAGAIDHVVTRYSWGTIILRPLNEGYFMVLALEPGARVALALHRSLEARERLNAEI
jgi:predicted regulator of Ras-like GTPase activity (Roadblock/LC7/MglB family)